MFSRLWKALILALCSTAGIACSHQYNSTNSDSVTHVTPADYHTSAGVAAAQPCSTCTSKAIAQPSCTCGNKAVAKPCSTCASKAIAQPCAVCGKKTIAQPCSSLRCQGGRGEPTASGRRRQAVPIWPQPLLRHG